MIAIKIFDTLGFKLLTDVDNNIPRKSWNYEKDAITYVKYIDNNVPNIVIKFYPKYYFYNTIKFNNGDDDDRSHKIGIGVHEAITYQMRELYGDKLELPIK